MSDARPFPEEAPAVARHGLSPLGLESQRTLERLLTLRLNLIQRHDVAVRGARTSEASRIAGLVGRVDEAVGGFDREPDVDRAGADGEVALAALRDEADRAPG